MAISPVTPAKAWIMNVGHPSMVTRLMNRLSSRTPIGIISHTSLIWWWSMAANRRSWRPRRRLRIAVWMTWPCADWQNVWKRCGCRMTTIRSFSNVNPKACIYCNASATNRIVLPSPIIVRPEGKARCVPPWTIFQRRRGIPEAPTEPFRLGSCHA